ncbi:hypothetical protein NEMBOFW57_004727 [Staphylotrichum longicolle]|uniref:Centrosomin N-terminal motif 1 domain-containing protein n=1 Tax=Staphylotrichum longicolle TaxID=669026 RepID=A0AAD4F8K4_9PEZI|nr:hypothetical protein NEMBOFW57_004727 [Staphylotrichum longicolle]
MDLYGAPSRSSNSSSRAHRTNPTEHPKSSPVYPISPLLQERLQRSRREESDRVSSRSSTDMLSSSTNSRHVRSPSPTGSHRTGSSGGHDPAKQKKGLGVKEMEQTLSTLHKQNFDLKLELYHRRERQTALEDRLDKLEREAKERDELNDSLVLELEKRDKAVEEAIGMILTLERRVEQLLLERKMVRQVETAGAAYPRIASPVTTPGPSNNPHLESSPFGEAKTPIRMPSFVSERSENTENLRSVYLGALAGESSLTLPRLPEDTPDTARIDPSGQYHNIGDVLDIRPSPLHRLEKFDGTRAAGRNSPRPLTARKDKEKSPFNRPSAHHLQPKTKQEKREALERLPVDEFDDYFSNPRTR